MCNTAKPMTQITGSPKAIQKSEREFINRLNTNKRGAL